jgi:hypothetical protein
MQVEVLLRVGEGGREGQRLEALLSSSESQALLLSLSPELLHTLASESFAHTLHLPLKLAAG